MLPFLRLFWAAMLCSWTIVLAQPLLQPRETPMRGAKPIPKDLTQVKQKLTVTYLKRYFTFYPGERPPPGRTLRECTDNYIALILAAKPNSRNAWRTALTLCQELPEFRDALDQEPSDQARTKEPTNRDIAQERRERAKIRKEYRPPRNGIDTVLQEKLRRASGLGAKYALAKDRLRAALKQADRAFEDLVAALDDIEEYGAQMKEDHERLLEEADPNYQPPPDRQQMVVEAVGRLNAARAYAVQVAREMGVSLTLNGPAFTPRWSGFNIPAPARWARGPRFI
ncbi:MAG: hypothetical protein M1823_005979 [Watsoniomyces obsoletus]|nr:MAG: hypothetical protein M1823_005979 [Watsoniomyces obsoletus]